MLSNIKTENLNLIMILTIPIMLLILFAQVIATEMKTNFKDIAFTFIGIFYIVFLTMFVVLIDGMEDGKIVLFTTKASLGQAILGKKVGDTFCWGENHGIVLDVPLEKVPQFRKER